MIELIDVKKKFKKRILFANVNVKIINPGIYSFIGENGCGKTTLLNIIGGFIKPSRGKVINKFRECSFVSQKVNLLDHLTIKEHFKMFNLDYNLLKKVNLFSKLDRYPKELSFGMKQRIAVLIGLYGASSLVICDEPTSHLDAYNSSIIMREIKRVSKDKVILLVCHKEEIINKYSDVIYEIRNKKLCLVKSNEKNSELLFYKKKKINFAMYFKEGLKNNKKVNFFFFIIFFFLFFMFNLTVNLKDNFSFYLTSGASSSLDYNKFYLKECVKENNGGVIIKKCFNLKEDKINLLKESQHEVSLNYDVFLNDLYEIDNLNVFNKNDVLLKEGRYPTTYYEVIASEGYFLGEEIVLETAKVINSSKVDIYKNKLVLKVVGISKDMPFINENKLYLNKELVEEHLKQEYLINNDMSLFSYFEELEIDNYKYTLYFKDVNLELLKENNIEYLSSSYEYYRSLNEAFGKITEILDYLNIFVGVTTLFYAYKLIKKKVESKGQDIIFFKASGVFKRRIIRVINKENNFFILLAVIMSFIFNYFSIRLIFEDTSLNYAFFVLLFFFSVFFNRKLLKRQVERRIAI